ncbi:MAG TPA: hypothetical protein VMS56_11365 [Thermoanaerobaculia bacterium]|nr:hypothetical protein [Thermoanaerobaculia bacterium]
MDERLDLSVERVRDLRKWREASDRIAADYYALELMLALYDHAPAILDAAEEWFELRHEVEQLRRQIEIMRAGSPR